MWTGYACSRESILAKLELELTDARLPQLRLWLDALRLYCKLRIDPRDTTGRQSYSTTTKLASAFRAWIKARLNIAPENLDTNAILQTKRILQARQQPNTLQQTLTALRNLLDFLVDRGELKFNVLELHHIPKKSEISRLRISPLDAPAVAAAALEKGPRGVPVAMAVLIMANTGLRIAELYNLRPTCFVPDHNILGPHLISIGKGDREHVVPLTLPFANILKLYLRKFCLNPRRDYVIHRPENSSVPYPLTSLRWAMDQAGQRARYSGPNFGSRNLRRGLAKALHTNGMRLDLIQKLYDHDDIRDTKKYVGRDETRIFEELNSAHPSFGGQQLIRRISPSNGRTPVKNRRWFRIRNQKQTFSGK